MRTAPQKLITNDIKPNLTEWHPPALWSIPALYLSPGEQGPWPAVGRPRRGFRDKASGCSFPAIVLGDPAQPLATYPGVADGGLCRCWRLLYSPDAASAPSRAAMTWGHRLVVVDAGDLADVASDHRPGSEDAAGGRSHLRQAPRRDGRAAPPPRDRSSGYTLGSPKGSRVNSK